MKFFFTLLSLFLFTALHGQEFTLIDSFDGLPENDNTSDFFFEAIAHQGFVYAAGTTRAVNAQDNQGDLLLIAKYNNQGQRIDSATFGFSELFPTKFLSLTNGNLLVTGQDADIGFIITLDSGLNIVGVSNYDFVILDIVENADGSFTTINGDDLVHIDADLTFNTSFDLDNANKTHLASLAPKGDNYLVFGTLTGIPSSSSGLPTSLYGSDDLVVAELTSDGEVVWSKNYGGASTEDAFFVNIDKGQLCEISATADGNYIFDARAKSWDADMMNEDYGNGDSDYDGWAVKINPTGDIIWQKKLGTKANEFGGRILELENGNFVVPVSLESFNESQDVLDCTDCQGDIAWSCILNGQTGAIMSQNWIDSEGDEFISRWVETDNGRLFGFGYSESSTLAGVELDYYDAIAVEWNISTPTNNVFVNPEIQIYPNPTEGRLTLQLPENTIMTERVLEILDTTGKIVMTKKVFSNEVNIEVADLMKGHYIIKVGEWSTKFVKI